MFNLTTGFWKGFIAPIHALKLILSSPKLLGLVAIPTAINIGIYILFFYYGKNLVDSAIALWVLKASALAPHWAVEITRIALQILSWIALVLIAAFTFTIISGIISAPFNDKLSRMALQLRLKQTAGTCHFVPVRADTKTTILLEAKRMGLLICGAVFAALVGLIPLMQLPALAMGALLVSFEYFGYPISQKSTNLTNVVFFTLRRPTVSLGFGTFLLLMMVLPFTSIFYIPLAVVGGTILYADSLPKT